ncbi:2OG-Fe(II) oxygenase protein [Rhizobium phage RHph_TM39]|uniref:2OG-Fe(II) oxygenase protein n=1 Tax=Rhizobium phage RHph_TM30 TaxID=2509764 RepID=A0A7S5R575_9CAUD|nr:2OG-Fe(II) oxygenase [Rhizobium phage RHph_TM30]QIG71576.1 2OG-Fe(II) oxygenase protein [Rhizobium phage RHph_TM40]QIG71939.1 2OG-Fe(II) oxygenase protein [Rhizobium phage RHph_TM2_3B]QIG72301.1 2OG-Fe(II) oxygenase protein [Rhizobium phage RHph_TM3_3_6]QIG77093.1 2OG-Fe(II) oxygenase protein [Rhizobium phage RHph_TM39]QIG77431.1 2OG-Fe(II) oxygenase protein [Rhizobium phage RHph_TM21B]QIG77692.1 2OG-Fe(II) oxygenase protein [Rhizobium phage RHph_TM61]
MKLIDYVMVLDNVLDHQTCHQIIDKFQSHGELESQRREGLYQFDQLNLNTAGPNWDGELRTIITALRGSLTTYRQEVPTSGWPQQFGWEQVRMKRYLPNDNDQFPVHVDVADYKSARRFLVFFMYLNDVDEGGETTFPELNVAVKPKAGRVLIFPPMWQYPHTGEKPISAPKFIIGSYLHYV